MPVHQYRTPAAPPPRIAVIPSVVRLTYCDGGDEEINVLQLRLKLTFRNDRDAPAVLYLGAPSVVRVVLAKDQPALRAGVFETELFPSVYSTGDAIVRKHFYVLQSGQQRSTDLPLAVPIPIAARAGVAAGIARAGSHVLRLTIQVWPDDPALAEQWAFRTLNIEDDYTRECVAIEVDRSLPGLRVTRVLDRLRAAVGLPQSIVLDTPSTGT